MATPPLSTKELEEQEVLRKKMEAFKTSDTSSFPHVHSIPNLKLLDSRLTPPPHPRSHVHPRPQSLELPEEVHRNLFRSLEMPRDHPLVSEELVRHLSSHEYEFLFDSEEDVQDVLLHHLLSASAKGKLEIVDHILSSHPTSEPAAAKDTTSIPTIPLRRFATLKVHLTITPMQLINRRDYDGRSALHLAAARGHISVVRYLISKGANVNNEDNWGATPIQEALRGRFQEVAVLLESHGAKRSIPARNNYLPPIRDIPRSMDDSEQRPRSRSSSSSSSNITSSSSSSSSTTSSTLQSEESTERLCRAAVNGDLPLIKRMADNGADLNAEDHDHRTALHLAVIEGQKDVVKYLLSRDDVLLEKRDLWGNTPLMEAFAHDRLPIIHLLKEKLKKRKKLEKQHSHSSSITNPTVQASTSLTKIGTAPPEEILDPMLGTAAGHGDLHLVERLINGGAGVNYIDYDKRTAAHFAAAEGHLPVLKLLQQHGADLAAEDNFGVTPLHEALKNNHSGVAEYLEGFRTDKNQQPAVEEVEARQKLVQKYMDISKHHSSLSMGRVLEELTSDEIVSTIRATVDQSGFFGNGLRILAARFEKDTDKSSITHFVESEGVEMIMAALLKAKGEDPKLTLHATHIFDLISQHEELVSSLVSHQVVEFVLTALLTAKEEQTKLYAASVLSSVTYASTTTKDDKAVRHFARARGIKRVLAALRKNRPCLELSIYLVKALWYVCLLDSKNAKRIELENGLDTLLHAWKASLKGSNSVLSAKFVHPCMGLMATLIARSGCSRALWTSFHFVDLLVTSMRMFSKDREIQRSGCSVLCVLLMTEDHVGDQTDNFALARQLKEKGAFETAVMAMEAFPDELELQENAALFFLSLTKFHHEFMIKEAVIASGAAEAIKKAHRHFPESQQLTIINRELTELTKPCCIS